MGWKRVLFAAGVGRFTWETTRGGVRWGCFRKEEQNRWQQRQQKHFINEGYYRGVRIVRAVGGVCGLVVCRRCPLTPGFVFKPTSH